jgi:nucleotide-binding universal stress UspA family protein
MDMKKILVPTSGYIPAKERGDAIIEVAKRLGAEVIVVHIKDPKVAIGPSDGSEGWAALKLFEDKGKAKGVQVRSYLATGELLPTLKRFSEDHKPDLILVGASPDRSIAQWVTFELICDCEVPVLVIPQDMSHLI